MCVCVCVCVCVCGVCVSGGDDGVCEYWGGDELMVYVCVWSV